MQKHVITHPDQAGRTRSRQNQNYPEKYFRVTILFSYELQLLCVALFPIVFSCRNSLFEMLL